MTVNAVKWAGIAAYVMATVLNAQQAPAGPAFEVVSIHPVPADAPLVMRAWDFDPVLPGGQYVNSRAVLVSMISFAYNVENASNRLLGLPGWAKERSFAVSAKAAQGLPALPPSENYEQVRLMVRAMLADRFHLQLHTETRRENVLSLEIAKGGIKIKEVDPPTGLLKERPVGCALGDDGGHMVGDRSTITSLAGVVSLFLKRPVIDRTGLTGYYSFDFRWSAPETADRPSASQELSAVGTGLLISAVQDLGFRLRQTKGAVRYWVVDHIEPPTEN
jgi:uncharacterized protein (TIGR03435 family)